MLLCHVTWNVDVEGSASGLDYSLVDQRVPLSIASHHYDMFRLTHRPTP